MNDWQSFFFDRNNFESRRDVVYSRENFNLEYARELVGRAGDPLDTRNVIHVAGTNGKGSTCFFIEQALLAAGERCGAFMSPHVSAVGERIRIMGQAADESSLAHAAALLEPLLRPDDKPTTFELLFLAALVLFREADLDWIVLETGVGGRLDTTNLCRPRLAVLTPIDIDHAALLGPTLADIAREKAGIIKPATPCLTARQEPVVRDILVSAARAVGAPLDTVDAIDAEELGFAGTRLRQSDGTKLVTRMPGREQAANLALALAAVERLGLKPDMARLGAALLDRTLPARIEVFPGSPTVIVDGAHNPQALRRLAGFLGRTAPKARVTAIVAMMADKDCAANMEIIGRFGAQCLVTALPSARAADPADLIRLAGLSPEDICPDPRAALARARTTTPADGIIVVCGSFVLAGCLRAELLQES